MALSEAEELELLELEEAEAQGQSAPATPAAQPSQPDSNPLQAALEGFGETATLGYLPQLQALASKPLYGALNAITGQDVQPGSYLEERDQNISRQQQLAQDNPAASLAGKGLGIAATSLLPVAGASKLAKFLNPASIKGIAGMGAAQGALYNPGDTEGEFSPLQLDNRLENAVLGAGTGAALGGISKGVSALKHRGDMIRQVKDSAGLSKFVKGKVDDALSQVNEKQIAPRAEKLKMFLQGKNVEVNPDVINDTFPNFANKLREKAGQGGRANIPAERALKLRKALDKAAGYKKQTLFDSAVSAKQEGAKRAADVLRGKLSDLGPEVNQLNSEMAPAIKASKALRQSANKAPISSITAKPGTDKASLVDLIDQLAGSDLEKTAVGIKQAQSSLINPVNFVKPLEAPNELRKLGLRGLIKGAEVSSKLAPKGSEAAFLQSLFEGKR